MISWHNTLHLFLIPFFWVEKSLGEEGLLEKLGKGKKLKVIFSSVETACGQLVPVPGGCQGSLASSWRHVLAFLAWCCYLHIVIEVTISSWTGISGLGVLKTRKTESPFWVESPRNHTQSFYTSLWSRGFSRFLSFRGKLWHEFFGWISDSNGETPTSITQFRLRKIFTTKNCFWP